MTQDSTTKKDLRPCTEPSTAEKIAAIAENKNPQFLNSKIQQEAVKTKPSFK